MKFTSLEEEKAGFEGYFSVIAHLRVTLKTVLAVNIVLVFSFFPIPLHAYNGLVANTFPQLETFNQQQVQEIANKNIWLRLASNNGDKDKDKDKDKDEDCQRRKGKRKCKQKKLTIKRKRPLRFGIVAAQQYHVTQVVISPVTGNKTVFGGPNLGGIYGPAKFVVKGKPGKSFVITLPSQIVLSGQFGGNLQASSLTVYLPFNQPPVPVGTLVGRLGQNGKATVLIGGTLLVNPGQRGGRYVGSFPLYADYLN